MMGVLFFSQAGFQQANQTLGPQFMTFASVSPGRAGVDALRDGWINLLLLSKVDALVAKTR